MTGKGIEVGKFVTVQTSDFAEAHGLKRGDTLYVAGDATVPVSEEDPYALRRILLCALTTKDGHLRADEGAITVDGLKLKAVSGGRQKKLEALMAEDFKDDTTS